MLLAICIFTMYLFTWKQSTWPKLSCSTPSQSWRPIAGMNNGGNWWEEVLLPPPNLPPGSTWRLPSTSDYFLQGDFAGQPQAPPALVKVCPLRHSLVSLVQTQNSLPTVISSKESPIGLNSSHEFSEDPESEEEMFLSFCIFFLFLYWLWIKCF